MGAIVLDASKVNSYVLPNLVKSKNTMQDAYSTGQSLRNCLPSSFQYRNTINDIVNSIYNIKREIGDVDTIISKKLERAKTIETRSDRKVASIASVASKIGSVTGAMAGGVAGAATGGLVTATVGAVVGSKVGSAVAKSLIETGAKVVNKFTSITKNIAQNIKEIGCNIATGIKTIFLKITTTISNVTKAIYNLGAKIVNYFKTGIPKLVTAILDGSAFEWIKTTVCKLGKTLITKIGDLFVGIGNYIKDLANDPVGTLKRTAASIYNFSNSIQEGLVSFVEALGDFCVILVGLSMSQYTAIADIQKGILKGDWSFSTTKALWTKGVMPIVGYDVTTKLFDLKYQYNPFAKKADELAYNTFKRTIIIQNEDGTITTTRGGMYKTGKAVGYITGVILLTVATFGTATAPTALTTSMSTATGLSSATVIQAGSGFVAFSGAFGKNTQEEYNALTDEEKQSADSIKKVLLNSGVQAGIEGTTFALTYGGGVKTLGVKEAHATSVKAGIQFTKTYVADASESIITGKEFDIKETTKAAILNAGVSIFYDKTVGKILGNKKKEVQGRETAFNNQQEELLKQQQEAAKKASEQAIGANAGKVFTSGNSAPSNINISVEKYHRNLSEELIMLAGSDGGKKVVGKFVKDEYKDQFKDIMKEVFD